jgi:predicted phosphodiesterase
MRALVLSDIHGNLQALQAVLAAAGEWDALWNLGDMVGYGGSPNEVLDLVRPLSTLTVRGNHDRVCCGISSSLNFNPTARAAAKWTFEALSPNNLEWLKSVPQGPLAASLQVPDAVPDAALSIAAAEAQSSPQAEDAPQVTLAHGSPLNEDHYIMNMRDAWAPLQQMPTAITFVGHTHVQGGFSQKQHDWYELRPRYRTRNDPDTWTLEIPPGTRHLINPGSVGQPRDGDWRAAFAIYDTAASQIVYHRVPYDLTGAQGRILMAGLPERLAARLREGR